MRCAIHVRCHLIATAGKSLQENLQFHSSPERARRGISGTSCRQDPAAHFGMDFALHLAYY
jgi:hypothetical protein